MSSDRFYHGDGDDQIGQVGNLLNGIGRYKVLWEDDKIKAEFGILNGVSKDSVREIINQPTLSGRKRITGRQLLLKARESLRESKILLAYWNDFTKNGGFPSGKNEDDALEFCKESLSTERQQNLEKDDDTDDDEDDDELSASQGRPINKTQKNNRVGDSDDEDAEDEGSDDGEKEIEQVSRRFYNSPALLTFMLLGPYGCEAYGFPVSAAFTIDTEGIEENAKNGMYNTKSIKEEKKVATDIIR